MSRFITAVLDEHELKGTGLVAFTADGASVMGTRQSLARRICRVKFVKEVIV